jgi:WD40 repeat protein
VALSFDAWKPGAVQPATVEVPVQVIEAVRSPQLTATLKGHENSVRQVAWSPDGKALATLSVTLAVKGEVKLWDIAERKERATLLSDLGEGYNLAFAPDSKTLFISHFKYDGISAPSGGIGLWDVASGQRKGLLQHTPPRGVGQFALAPNGKMIAAAEYWKEGEKGAFKSCVTLWEVAGGKPRASLADVSTSALAFSPDGKVLAWSTMVIKDKQIAAIEIRRRDLTQEQDLPALPNTVSKAPVNCLAFSPDGRTLAGADYQGNIILWDTASGKVRTTMKQEDGRRVMSLAFSPDSKTLAAAVGDRPGRDREPGLIELWDADTGQLRLVLTGHTNAVLSVAFSPDGKLLASGSSDRTARLWDMTTVPATGAASGGK